MGVIARQAFYFIFATALIYGAAVAASFAIYPPAGGTVMDSASVSRKDGAIFLNAPRYVVWNRAPLMKPGTNVILLGGSNLRQAVRLDEIRKGLKGKKVHNLTVGGSNMTQMKQIIDLVYEVLPPGAAEKTTFVLGLSYAIFVHDAYHWQVWEGAKTSRIENEMLRFGLYRKKDGGFSPALPPRLLPALTFAMRPYFAVARLKKDLGAWWRGKKPAAPSKPRIMDAEAKAESLRMWDRYMGAPDGKLRDEQFYRLLEIVGLVKRNGGRLVLVDMPLPRWHRARSPYFRDYEQRKQRFIEQALAAGNVSYLNYIDAVTDSEYRDSGHVNEAGAVKFSRLLGRSLAKVLAQGSAL